MKATASSVVTDTQRRNNEISFHGKERDQVGDNFFLSEPFGDINSQGYFIVEENTTMFLV